MARRRERYPSRPVYVLASVTDSLVNIAWHFVRDAGLPAIFVLMLAESACIPIPSEATMLFAGFAVADPGQSAAHHHLTLIGVVAAGVLGNLVGSWLAYWVGRAGRLELVERHGAKLHIKPSHLAWADRWFERYGAPAIFFSRMLPVIRTFISLPAGVARMPFWRFTLLTLAGCIPWVLALELLGEGVGHRWHSVKDSLQYVDYAIVALVVVGVIYLLVRWRRVRAQPAWTRPHRLMGDAAGEPLPIVQAVALGLLHGPAELLPISSSGHVTLVPWLLGWSYPRLDPELRKSFEVALHAGTAAALLVGLRAEESGGRAGPGSAPRVRWSHCPSRPRRWSATCSSARSSGAWAPGDDRRRAAGRLGGDGGGRPVRTDFPAPRGRGRDRRPRAGRRTGGLPDPGRVA